jgi:pyridoxal/pyridoxine/pyridoxamine kinase
MKKATQPLKRSTISHPKEVVHTTGTGDVFHGAYLTILIKGVTCKPLPFLFKSYPTLNAPSRRADVVFRMMPKLMNFQMHVGFITKIKI